MVKKIMGVILIVASVVLFSGLTFLSAEENAPAETTQGTEDSQVQWIWGEVVSVDAASSSLVVKYLDYESEQETEKQITFATDSNTLFENVVNLPEIKAGDTVSVDYVTSAEGKNTAKTISVEKPESEQPAVQE
jgi:hypothetical protein